MYVAFIIIIIIIIIISNKNLTLRDKVIRYNWVHDLYFETSYLNSYLSLNFLIYFLVKYRYALTLFSHKMITFFSGISKCFFYAILNNIFFLKLYSFAFICMFIFIII
jgi:hypothetical protein